MSFRRALVLLATHAAFAAACSSQATSAATGDGGVGSSPGNGGGGAPVTLGATHAGDYALGPVEFHGSFPNSCGPYTPALEAQAGAYLAGVGLSFNGDGQLCDACILVRTRMGKSVVAKVVTTGETKGPNDIDLSKAAYDAIFELDPQGTSEHPRPMTWQIAKCPVTGKVHFQFQTGAHYDWSSFWVRNTRVPLDKVEVKSARHASFAAVSRGGDGTYTDGGGFGQGAFTLRLTGADGQVIEDTFPSFKPGDVLVGTSQFE